MQRRTRGSPLPNESELVEPPCEWLKDEFSEGHLLLIHEEASGRGGRRPDILVVVSDLNSQSVDDVTMVAIEIENSSKGALRDPKNGLRQLRKYPAHEKYLAIPATVANRNPGREIPRRCEKSGVGLLVVDHMASEVRRIVPPTCQVPTRTLRTYPVAMARWLSLRASRDEYRRISRNRIVEAS